MAEFRCPTRLANTIDRGVAGVIFDIGNQDPCAFLSEQLADGFADSVCATRNDGDLVFQPVHVSEPGATVALFVLCPRRRAQARAAPPGSERFFPQLG